MDGRARGLVAGAIPHGLEPDGTCPDCDGIGVATAIVDYADRTKSGLATMECMRCRGSGTITGDAEAWYLQGKAHRDAR